MMLTAWDATVLGIYTRKDRLVRSLDALEKRLGNCSHMAKTEFSATETQNTIKYLWHSQPP